MYRIPEYAYDDDQNDNDDNDTDEYLAVDLRIHCIESQHFILNKTANAVVKNGWIPIQNGDESTDFAIRSGDKITLGFSGSIKPFDGLPVPTLTFLKGGTCFADLKLQFPEKKHREGFVMMYRKSTLLDWKRLVWKSLREKYEGTWYTFFIAYNFLHVIICFLTDYLNEFSFYRIKGYENSDNRW